MAINVEINPNARRGASVVIFVVVLCIIMVAGKRFMHRERDKEKAPASAEVPTPPQAPER